MINNEYYFIGSKINLYLNFLFFYVISFIIYLMVWISVETISRKSILIEGENANEIRKKIEKEMGIPKNDKTLLLNGKKLNVEKIENNSLIILIISLEGGAKGKNEERSEKNKKEACS